MSAVKFQPSGEQKVGERPPCQTVCAARQLDLIRPFLAVRHARGERRRMARSLMTSSYFGLAQAIICLVVGGLSPVAADKACDELVACRTVDSLEGPSNRAICHADGTQSSRLRWRVRTLLRCPIPRQASHFAELPRRNLVGKWKLQMKEIRPAKELPSQRSGSRKPPIP